MFDYPRANSNHIINIPQRSIETYWNLMLLGIRIHYWLVVWNICFHPYIYIGNNNPNWLSYFSEGFKPPTRLEQKICGQEQMAATNRRIIVAAPQDGVQTWPGHTKLPTSPIYFSWFSCCINRFSMFFPLETFLHVSPCNDSYAWTPVHNFQYQLRPPRAIIRIFHLTRVMDRNRHWHLDIFELTGGIICTWWQWHGLQVHWRIHKSFLSDTELAIARFLWKILVL